MTKVLERQTRNDMTKIAKGLPSKAEKIRRLRSADYPLADIARFLKIRYQHVRNVVIRAEEKEARQAMAETPAKPPAQVLAQVGPEGRIVIPAAYRRLLGIESGGHVIMLLEEGEIRLIGRDGAIARAQALVAPYLEDESTSTDAFLAERRREAQREASGG
jgi:AbrB family looped-hinge helix DNA binding protein